jgi:hypothetical protein
MTPKADWEYKQPSSKEVIKRSSSWGYASNT